MGKKKATGSKASIKEAKKKKAANKATEKIQRKQKDKENDKDDEDLEAILAKIQRDWEETHKVTEELVEGPPSRRASAVLLPCPNGNHLWCIGGEFYSPDEKAYFYNDVFRYSPDKDEWRKFVSPTAPGPRSAHAAVATPIGGGKIFLFGGEFSSLNQHTFHHYRDFWCFDISTHSWDRIETKVLPSARSGHRMAMWKHYIVLFGGFYDAGVTTRYLNDLWVFDIHEYKWRQIEYKETELRPSARSGFSFLPTADGMILHGGYCKEYRQKRPVGIMLEDTWLLRMSVEASAEGTASTKDPLKVKWERRKRPSTAYAPSLRSGCTMAVWTARSMGIMFGGVTDDDTGEETLESQFHNDLNGYDLSGKGRWVSMRLKQKKKQGGPSHKKVVADETSDEENPATGQETDPDDPNLSTPLPRYNAMLAILRNTLYIYGGIYEHGSKEYTLDDFYSLQLDKMDRYVCLKESPIVIMDESSDDDEDDDDDEDEGRSDDAESDDGSDGSVVEEEAADSNKVTSEELRSQVEAFMGVSKDDNRSAEEIIRTPYPGETLAMYYLRSKEYWTLKAHETSENRGKQLRRDGFAMAEEQYDNYKPILEEVEKILAEAGVDDNDIRSGGPAIGGSRNRR